MRKAGAILWQRQWRRLSDVRTSARATLFNKIARLRISIVEDVPGVTRDRIYYETEWNGKPIVLIDTGGIEPKTDDMILEKMKTQAEIAIETADVIVFMCDVHAGVTADDRDIAVMLIKSGEARDSVCE